MCMGMPKSSKSHSCEGTLHVLTHTLAQPVASMKRQRSERMACGTRSVSGRPSLRSESGTGTST